MGKIRRQRRKLHPSAPREGHNDVAQDISTDSNAGLLQPSIAFSTAGLSSDTPRTPSEPTVNPRRNEDEDDRMSFISKKSLKGDKQMKKVEKRKLRHERWLQKIETIQTADREKREAKRRAGVPVVGDMHPLKDALPELSEILEIGEHYAQKRAQLRNLPKARATMTMKDRQKLVTEETARFQEVLSHSAFKSNPFSTINLHLKNKLKQENEEKQTCS